MNTLSVMEHLICKLKQQFLERMNENLMNEKSLSIPKFWNLGGEILRYRILGQESQTCKMDVTGVTNYAQNWRVLRHGAFCGYLWLVETVLENDLNFSRIVCLAFLSIRNISQNKVLSLELHASHVKIIFLSRDSPYTKSVIHCEIIEKAYNYLIGKDIFHVII